MLDIQFIRDNPELIRYAAERRGIQLNLQPLLDADDERKRLSLALQGKKARIRVLERLAQTGDAQASASLLQIQSETSQEETQYSDALQRFKREMVHIPNMPDISVPTGGETEAVVEVGKSEHQPQERYSFADICERAGIQHIARGENTWIVPSAPNYEMFLTLQSYAHRYFISAGFSLARSIPGVSRDACIASGATPEEVNTFLSDTSFGLVGTTVAPYLLEARVGSLYEEGHLPQHHLGIVEVFRDSAIRSFGNVLGTLTICLARHDVSVEQHENIRACYERFLQSLHIPFRTSVVTARAAHQSSVKSYEIDIPLLAERYVLTRVHYYHDYQSRRAGLKYVDAAAKTRFAHTVVSDGLCLEELFAIVQAIHGDGTRAFLDSLAV